MDSKFLRAQLVWASVAVPLALSVATGSSALFWLGSLTATVVLALLATILLCVAIASWFIPSMPMGADRDKLLDLLEVFVAPRPRPGGPVAALAQRVLLVVICWLAGAHAIAVLFVVTLVVGRWLLTHSLFLLALYARSVPKEASPCPSNN